MANNRVFFFTGFALASALWIFLGTLSLHPSSTFPPTFLNRGRHRGTTFPLDYLSRSACTVIGRNRCASLTPANGKTCILILASLRTGSSFMGELLANNRNVFYLFEPGMYLTWRLKRIKAGKLLIENVLVRMIQDLFQCDFRNLHFYLRSLSRLKGDKLLEMAPRLYDYCTEHFPQGNCKITENVAREVCLASRYIAIKTIRIPDLSLVLPIAERNVLNLRVVHLVRDPRPMIASRFYVLTHQHLSVTFNNESQTLPRISQEFLSIYCKYNWQNFELGSRNPNMRQNYLFVRYEDAAVDPLATAKRLYRFINSTEVPPASVLDWIELNTKSGDEHQELFTTKRNSSAAYQRWRRALPLRLAKEIEGVGQCRAMMLRMGYIPVEDDIHLRNMSFPLIGDVEVVDNKRHSWLWF